MLKQILVIAGGLALAVSLPLVALAVTTDQTPSLDDIAVATTDDLPQPAFQQQLRVHAETRPPENLEPVRQRLHQSDDVASGEQHALRRQQADGFEPGNRNMVGREQVGGGVCTAECPIDGEPSRTGDRGSGGAGPHGHGGRGKG